MLLPCLTKNPFQRDNLAFLAPNIKGSSMSYTVQRINSCTRKLVFNFEAVDLTQEIKAALTKKQRDANLKGFRKGKAPLAMVQKIFGPQVENEALYQFISGQFFDAVKKEDLKAVGYPSFANTKYEDKKVSFEATIEVFPEIALRPYESYQFEQDDPAVTNKDLQDLRERYLSSKAQMIEVADKNATLQKGQSAVMNFQGVKEDGDRPENMKGEEYVLEIGSGQFIPGFEDQMVGMKAGEKRDLHVTFPAEYHEPSLKSAKVKFEVELLEIKEKKLPELTDELVKEFGFESAADFDKKNHEQLVYQKDRMSKEKLHQAMLEKFVGENSFDVPTAMVYQQEEHVKKDLEEKLKNQGFNDKMVKEYLSKWHEDVHAKATFQVRSGLILDQLGKDMKIEVTPADIEVKMQDMAKHSGLSLDKVKAQFDANAQANRNLYYSLREEKTFNELAKKVKITTKK